VVRFHTPLTQSRRGWQWSAFWNRSRAAVVAGDAGLGCGVLSGAEFGGGEDSADAGGVMSGESERDGPGEERDSGRVRAYGCRKLVRRLDQGFRGGGLVLSRPSICRQLGGAVPNPPPPKVATPRSALIRDCRSRHVSRRTERVADRTVRVDRVVSEFRHSVTVARANPQVTGPDEFSAPTGFGALTH
jgi:hypothetical protein